MRLRFAGLALIAAAFTTPSQMKYTADGGTARPISDKLGDVVSVKDFGAKGDGVTDDTANIQTAVNSAAAAGRPVIVPPGLYMIQAQQLGSTGFDMGLDAGGVKLPSNSHLIIQAGAVLQAITNSWYASNVIRMIGASNVTIDGPGAVIGDRATHDFSNPAVNTPINRATEEWGVGINVRGSTDVQIRGVTVTGATGDAITVGAASGTDPDTHRVRISGCRLDSSRRNDISVIDRAYDVRIDTNTILNAGVNDSNSAGTAPRAGIDIEAGLSANNPKNVAVSNNLFLGNWNESVGNFNGQNVTISGNVADAPISYGFGVNTSITGNTILEGAQTDPALLPAWSSIIAYRQGDRSVDSVAWTAQIANTNVEPNSPAWSGATTYAIGDVVTSGSLTYQSLQSSNLNHSPSSSPTFWVAVWAQIDSALSGIVGNTPLNGKPINTTINGNTVQGFGSSASLAAGDSVVFSGNTLRGARADGVVVVAATGAIVSNNKIHAPPTGILVFPASDRVLIEGNLIESASTVGIVAGITGLSSAMTATIRGNRIRFSPTSIKLIGGRVVVDGNQMYPDGVGSESTTISLAGASGTGDFVVTGNLLEGVANIPITVSGNPIVRLDHNRIRGATTASAAMSITSTARVEVVDNVVSFNRGSNGGIGIFLTGGTTGALVEGNRIYSETAFALSHPIETDTSAGLNRIVHNITSTGTNLLNATDVSILTTDTNMTIASGMTLTASDPKNKGTITLSAGSGTATVLTGALCACSDTTANASVKCAVTTTTLTATGTGTDVIAYLCL